jgi:catechol 2,3-dioxygenase-like lactoylglutathione lyase family enzyme
MHQTAPIEIGLSVIDLDRMLEFYASVLSCVEVRRREIPAAMSASLGMAEHGYLCVWLATPHGERIKLMSPVTPPVSPEVPEYLTSTTGVSFFTFYCDDLTQSLGHAEELGATLRSDRSFVAPELAMRLCFLTDPEGNVFELVERNPANS